MGADLPLTRLGRYELLGLLATGGMAEVFLARQEGPAGFERPVVVKRVLPHLARQREFREMFLDEARIVSRLHHPNVVSVYELGDDKNELFLVMEYLEGENLGTLLRYLRKTKELLSIRLAAHIAAEACAGLHAAHELCDEQGKRLDIVHRDVSPQNTFIQYAGQVKVIDFGIAKAIDRQAASTQTGQVKGKFAYMAPEQIKFESVDRRADIFAMGAVLHELFTGEKLFSREHDLLMFKALCEDPIPHPSAVRRDLPVAFDAIVMRALARNPAERYESAAAMRRDLLSALRGIPGDELPEEELAHLMRKLFADRIGRQQEVLRRMRSGQEVTDVPSAEPTGSEITVAAPSEPATKSAAVSAGQAISISGSVPKRRNGLRGAALVATAVGAIIGVWIFAKHGSAPATSPTARGAAVEALGSASASLAATRPVETALPAVAADKTAASSADPAGVPALAWPSTHPRARLWR